MCPYTIIALSVNGYVSLMRLRVDKFLPLFLTRNTLESTIDNTAPQTRFRRIIIVKHKVLTAPSFNSASDGSGVQSRDQLAHKTRNRKEEDHYPNYRTARSQ